LLAYYPGQIMSDSDFRQIDVHLAGVPASAKYVVRHRTGYYVHGQ
jgi:hypothetical protein